MSRCEFAAAIAFHVAVCISVAVVTCCCQSPVDDCPEGDIVSEKIRPSRPPDMLENIELAPSATLSQWKRIISRSMMHATLARKQLCFSAYYTRGSNSDECVPVPRLKPMFLLMAIDSYDASTIQALYIFGLA